MKFIDEKDYHKILRDAGIGVTEDGRSLNYTDGGATLGFDFTNLAAPDTSRSPIEVVGMGDRSVEYTMVAVMFKIIETLGLFPLFLYSGDDEWADENLAELAGKNYISKEEAQTLDDIVSGGHAMDVIEIGADEVPDAVRVITPQLTTFSTYCCVTDANGRFLATFSEDDEVSFNTKEPELYGKAKEALGALGDLPFEVITAPGAE